MPCSVVPWMKRCSLPDLLDPQHAEERPLGVQRVCSDQGRDEDEHGDARGKERRAGRATREQPDRGDGDERQRRRHQARRAQADHRDDHRCADHERANELRSPGEVASTRPREVRSQRKRQDDRDRVFENRREHDRRDERGENAAADAADGEQKVVLGQVLRRRPLECETPVHEQRDEEEVHDVDRDHSPDREHDAEDRSNDERARDGDRPADDRERQDLPPREREHEADRDRRRAAEPRAEGTSRCPS